ncbi:metallophosphoesterase family protein [Geminisphaera colitermitum]|uniref:metallophosphoesterase family protein n=1 Tax=Geminisphaera colitermitum TaxID=1148786 RepID=UPI000158C4ED|nr:metallophosphoesterase family protein [Geminisphaera colitermitum]
MRIHLLSDLHLEFAPFVSPRIEVDCVVLAGDIGTRATGLRWIRETYSGVPVIYVLGNHEFYGERLPRLTEKFIEQAAGTNVHILENSSIEIGGFRFFGATLWTDFMLLDAPVEASAAAIADMNDYARVRHWPSHRKLRPHHTREAHAHSRRALEEFLTTGDPVKSIVVTHHAPSLSSLPEYRQTDLISSAYASRLDDLILRHQPALWVHGHIHHASDYRIGRTRVVSNPRGYPDEPVPGFQADRVLDVG